MRLDGLVIGPQATAGVPCHVIGTTGDKGDVAMSMPDEMPDRFQNAAAIVGYDGRTRFSRSDKDQGLPGRT
jgi:hypothetical protein